MWKSLSVLLLSASAVVARGPSRGRPVVPLPAVPDRKYNVIKETFQQTLDHSSSSSGTFSQRYWYDDTYWKGPGSPVIIFTPGEISAAEYAIPYCTNLTIDGLLAEKIGAATIVIEHRYWGESSPYTELTTANMQYLTLENAIQDLIHFAQTVKLPFTKGAPSNAKDVPWVLIGGSYSGALTAWTMYNSPGTYWAGLATSAVVEPISDFYEYFEPISQGMPQNCSVDVQRAIQYIDNVLIHGSQKQQTALKAMFGLEDVEHNTDFVSALTNGPSLWQDRLFFGDSGFYQFCDYVENAVNVTNPADLPGPNGVGTQKAVEGYGKWFKDVSLPGYCESFGYFKGTDNTECYNTYNASSPLYTDLSVDNTYDRQWDWMLCNQPFGWWQGGPKNNQPYLSSKLLQPQYWVRQCAQWFPTGPQGQTYGLNKGVTEADTVKQFGGWLIPNITRMIFTNGQYDPWRPVTVSSMMRPGGPRESTPEQPVFIVPDGTHANDLLTQDDASPGCAQVQAAELAQLSQWVSEFPKNGGGGGW